MPREYSLNPNAMALGPTALAKALSERVAQASGVTDARILQAFERVPREAFLPPDLASRAYEDTALPIGLGQTISQPSMIALMLQALQCAPQHRVLEVGSGSGYVLALRRRRRRRYDSVPPLPVNESSSSAKCILKLVRDPRHPPATASFVTV